MATTVNELLCKWTPKDGERIAQLFGKRPRRLFTIFRNENIGTEVRNNLTGMRYFQDPNAGHTVGNVVFRDAATCIEPSGEHYTVSGRGFNRLLSFAETFHPSEEMKPIIIAGDGTRPSTLVNAKDIDRYLTEA